jgi:uncharacterized membrane protein
MAITAEHPLRRSSRPATVRPPQPAAPSRLEGIDLVRGLVIVIMALDHVRAYFTDLRFDPTDLSRASTVLFLTRWITHYCAPVFVLLAGVSAGLAARRRSPSELSRFLLTRGLWLIVVEFTVVNLAWRFNLRLENIWAQVIWAIGASMVVLAALCRLPRSAVGVIGLVLIAGHNLLDGIAPSAFGSFAALWNILHVRGPIFGGAILVFYPLLPWLGVMAAGWFLAGLWTEHSAEYRRSTLAMIGAAAIALFIALRLTRIYGDPSPWDPGSTSPILSVLNTTKYPASLQYLLMTLGPACLLLAALDGGGRSGFRWLADFGRVPLFFYVVHLYLIHGLAVLVAATQGFHPAQMMEPFTNLPVTWGVGLGAVYLVWAGIIAMLYPVSLWYGRMKAAGRGWWWGYL